MMVNSKKIELQLSNAHREIHEKDAQLNSAQERIIQLRQEVKFLETEYIKARATIMKLEEEKSKNIPASVSKKSKKEQQLNKETLHIKE